VKKYLFRPDVLIGLSCALFLVLATEYAWLGDYGPSGQAEVGAVVLYAWSVWLAVKNSVWNWVVSVVATALYLCVFLDLRFYADAGLQVVYIVFAVVGLIAWMRRETEPQAEEAERASAGELIAVVAAVFIGAVIVREYLIEINGAAPFWDATLTASSLGALYLLIRKRIENWLVWAVVDIAYIGVFISRDLYLSAVLYVVLLAMVLRAFSEWQPLLDERPEPESAT